MTIVMDVLYTVNWLTFVVLIVVLYLTYEWYKRRNLPPGPFSIPLLGSVGIYGKMVGVPPHVALAKMAETHGDIFSVWVGPSLLVVLNGYKAIYQAYVTQGSEFTDRPNWMPLVEKGLKDGNGKNDSQVLRV